MIGQILAAVTGTVAFSVLFGVPKRYYPYCGLIGGAGWAVYLAVCCVGSQPEACLVAAMAVVLLSRAVAVRQRCPVTIFLIAGIFPLVPGAGIYWTAYYIVTDQLSLAARTGYQAVKAAVAIVIGIVFVFEIPQSLFRRILGTEMREEKG